MDDRIALARNELLRGFVGVIVRAVTPAVQLAVWHRRLRAPRVQARLRQRYGIDVTTPVTLWSDAVGVELARVAGGGLGIA